MAYQPVWSNTRPTYICHHPVESHLPTKGAFACPWSSWSWGQKPCVGTTLMKRSVKYKPCPCSHQETKGSIPIRMESVLLQPLRYLKDDNLGPRHEDQTAQLNPMMYASCARNSAAIGERRVPNTRDLGLLAAIPSTIIQLWSPGSSRVQ